MVYTYSRFYSFYVFNHRTGLPATDSDFWEESQDISIQQPQGPTLPSFCYFRFLHLLASLLWLLLCESYQHVISFARSPNSSPQTSQYAKDFLHFNSKQTFIIVNAVGIPARIITSLLADRYGIVKEIFMGGVASAAVIFYSWSRVETPSSLYALCTAFGLVIGTLQDLFLAVSSSFAKDERTKGVRIGVLCTVSSFSSLTGPPLGGAIIHLSHEQYTPAAMWTGTSVLVAFLLLLGGEIHEYTASTRTTWALKLF